MQEKQFYGRSLGGFHRVAYTEWGRASAQPPVICVHGYARNGRDFDYLARALEADRQVFCPDIAGRGRSDWLASPTDRTATVNLYDKPNKTGNNDTLNQNPSFGNLLTGKLVKIARPAAVTDAAPIRP